MDIHTTQPAIHVYTANQLTGDTFDLHAKHAAVSLNTCNYHDATNLAMKEQRGNGSLLSMGQLYQHVTVHKFKRIDIKERILKEIQDETILVYSKTDSEECKETKYILLGHGV